MNSASVQIRIRALAHSERNTFRCSLSICCKSAASFRMSEKFLFDLKSGMAHAPVITEICAFGSFAMSQSIFSIMSRGPN